MSLRHMHCLLNMFCKYDPCTDPVYSSLIWKIAEMGKVEYSPKMFEVVLFLNAVWVLMTCFMVRLAQAFLEEDFTKGRKSEMVFHTMKFTLEILLVSRLREVSL